MVRNRGITFLLVAGLAVGCGSSTPGLGLSTASLDFTAVVGDVDPAAQTVTVTNTGSGDLSAPTATVDYGHGASGWLGVQVSGSVAPFTVSVQPHLAGLEAGTYSATVSLASEGAATKTLPVQLTVSAAHEASPGALVLSTHALSFLGQRNGTGPAATVTVSQDGTGTLSVPTTAITYVNGEGWLTASVTGSSAPFSITVQPQLSDLPAGSYQATITVTSEGATNSPQTIAVSLEVQPYANLTSGMAASVVIGQPDFGTTTALAPPTASSLAEPWGAPAVVDGRLILGDGSNNRVLVFDTVPAENGAAADLALGQPDLVSNASALSATGLFSPEQVSASEGRLAVVDASNKRVLIWNQVPSDFSTPADVVVGQVDMTTSTQGCSASSLNSTEGGMLVGGKLIVADEQNYRILIWNTAPTSNGQPADLVLGQPDLTTCSPSGLSATQFDTPQGVWSDGTRLLVADSDNHRVLLWNTFPTQNGQAPDVVLGQADFVTKDLAPSLSGMVWPISVTSNGTQIAVADCSANRVLVWNTFPGSNGVPADVVLGQADLSGTDANRGDGSASASGLSCPSAVTLFDDALLVGDATNNRYLVFR